MLVVETSVFFLFLGAFCTWLLLSDRLARWRDKREAERIAALLASLEGDDITHVLDRFGPPREQFTGSSGRSLYVWRCPPSTGMPPVHGLVVVTMTVDPEGRVVESAWQRR
jgi:hypothetical protein